MSFFTQIFSASTEASDVIETRPADSVLSATGLSDQTEQGRTSAELATQMFALIGDKTGDGSSGGFLGIGGVGAPLGIRLEAGYGALAERDDAGQVGRYNGQVECVQERAVGG